MDKDKRILYIHKFRSTFSAGKLGYAAERRIELLKLQFQLLEKIEELYLHVIELEKRVK